jgi:hypothetical protein
MFVQLNSAEIVALILLVVVILWALWRSRRP